MMPINMILNVMLLGTCMKMYYLKLYDMQMFDQYANVWPICKWLTDMQVIDLQHDMKRLDDNPQIWLY